MTKRLGVLCAALILAFAVGASATGTIENMDAGVKVAKTHKKKKKKSGAKASKRSKAKKAKESAPVDAPVGGEAPAGGSGM